LALLHRRLRVVRRLADWLGMAWNDEKRTIKLVGEVLESVPPKHLVLTWPHPSGAAEKSNPSRVTFEIEKVGDMVRLKVIHRDLKAGSVLEERISAGWPRVITSMKPFLETGVPLDTWAGHEYDWQAT
jgi:uncharacterized protein YndB with AHSA1/START domain